MYVLVLYTGNDFLDAFSTAVLRSLVRDPPRPHGYMSRLEKATAENDAAVWQGLNQIYFFKTYPHLMTLALDIAVEQVVEIQRICATKGIEFVVLALPVKCEVEWDREPNACADARDTLGIGEEDLDINKTMARKYQAKLIGHGIEVMDFLPDMLEVEERIFWDKDHHLNHLGHEVAAQLFFDRFGARILANSRHESRTE